MSTNPQGAYNRGQQEAKNGGSGSSTHGWQDAHAKAHAAGYQSGRKG